jgi:hypothetical protein
MADCQWLNPSAEVSGDLVALLVFKTSAAVVHFTLKGALHPLKNDALLADFGVFE